MLVKREQGEKQKKTQKLHFGFETLLPFCEEEIRQKNCPGQVVF